MRVTASELRKKLAQYYYEDGHSDEIRVELPPGNYLPRFRRLQAENTTPTDQAAIPSPELADSGELPNEEPVEAPVEIEQIPASSFQARRTWRLVAGVVCVVLIAATAFFVRLGWRQTHSPLDDFWGQLVDNSNRVLIVMPVIGSDNRGTDAQLRTMSAKPTLSLEDADIAVRIAGQLERRNAHYSLVSSADVLVDQLRTGPAVLIGALDNIWTKRLTQKLPFVFEEAADHRTGRIIDVSSGGSRN